MTSSIYNIIDEINKALCKLVPGGEWLGVATGTERGPAHNQKSVAPDDKVTVRSYHKLGTLTSRTTQGVGRGLGNQVNTYTNSMVVFLNTPNLYPDVLLLAIQANFPEVLGLEPYTSVNLTINRSDMDSETVYKQELANAPFKLKANQYLFRVTYTVETTFKKGCFKMCLQN